MLSNRNSLGANHIKNLLRFSSCSLQLKGSVTSNPILKDSKTTFELSVRELFSAQAPIKTRGKIRVIVRSEISRKISYADKLRLRGRIFTPFDFRRSGGHRIGGFDYPAYLAKDDIYFIMNIKEKEDIELLGQDRRYWFLRIVGRINDRFNDLLFSYLPQLNASVYSAMLLGRRVGSYAQAREFFIKSGTAHILAISGLHVGLIAFIISLALKAFGLRRQPRLIILGLALVFYCIFSGMRPSVLRATIMAIFVIVGLLLEREANIYNSLTLAALLLLFFEPRYVFDVGFQLSFTAVLGIVLFSPLLTHILGSSIRKVLSIKAEGELPSLFKFLAAAFSVSLTAYLSVGILILYHFKIITPLAVIANVIIIPLLFLCLGLGLSFLISASLFGPLANILAAPAGMAAGVLIQVTSFFSRLPGAYFFTRSRISLWLVFGYYLSLAVLAFFVLRKSKQSMAPVWIP